MGSFSSCMKTRLNRYLSLINRRYEPRFNIRMPGHSHLKSTYDFKHCLCGAHLEVFMITPFSAKTSRPYFIEDLIAF